MPHLGMDFGLKKIHTNRILNNNLNNYEFRKNTSHFWETRFICA